MMTRHQRPSLPGWGARAGSRTRRSRLVRAGLPSGPRALEARYRGPVSHGSGRLFVVRAGQPSCERGPPGSLSCVRVGIAQRVPDRCRFAAWPKPPEAEHACRTRARRRCRSALLFGASRLSFCHVVLCSVGCCRRHPRHWLSNAVPRPLRSGQKASVLATAATRLNQAHLGWAGSPVLGLSVQCEVHRVMRGSRVGETIDRSGMNSGPCRSSRRRQPSTKTICLTPHAISSESGFVPPLSPERRNHIR
jgi:hypothetical protein